MSTENGETAPWRRSVEVRLAMLEAAGELYQEGLAEQQAVTTAMDADVSSVQNEFRAQRSLLQALADTQSEHTEMLRDHGERLTRLEAGVVELQTGVADLQTGLATVGVGVQTIIGLLDREIESESGAGRNPASPE